MLEEAEGGRSDCDEGLVVPDNEGVVELFCDCESGYIPWLETDVRREEVEGVGGLTFPPWYVSSGYLPVAIAASAGMPKLIE